MATQKVYSLDLEAGSSQYAYITDANQTGLDLSGDFTIECWVKSESTPTTGQTQIVTAKWSDTGNQRSYLISYENPSGTPRLVIGVSADGTNNNVTYYSWNITLNTVTYTHIAISCDISEANKFVLYVNGVSLGSGSNSYSAGTVNSIYNSTATFSVGRHDGGFYYDGLIQEVRVWSDVRTQAEIATNMFTKLVPANEANLVGYWRFENDYLDETANNNDLTASGSPVFVSTPDSVPFTYYLESEDNLSAMKFDGSNDGLSITDHSDLKPTGAYTIGLWMKTTATGEQGLFGSYRYDGTNIGGILLYTSGSSQKAVFAQYDGTSTDSDGIVRSDNALNDGRWHFIVCTYNGTDTMSMYVDGKIQSAQVEAPSTIGYLSSNTVRIGCYNQNGTNQSFFNGSLDHVFLINGTALSETEVEGLLAKKINITDFPNLKALWDFEGNLNDTSASTNTHNASLIDAPYYTPDPAFDARGNRRSITFNGSSTAVSITDHSTLKPTGSFTMGCWVKMTAVSAGVRTVMQSFNYDGSKFSGIVIDIGSDEKPYGFVGYSTNMSGYLYSLGTTTMTAGEWYFVVLTWDGNYYDLYVDGIREGHEASTTAPAYTATNYPTIGYSNRTSGGATQYFDGSVDGAFLVNGTAWDATKISSYMTSRIDPAETNLKLLLPFDNNYVDLSSSNNNATPVSTPTFSWIVPFDGSVTSSIKTINGLAYASVKTLNGLATASVKSFNGLA